MKGAPNMMKAPALDPSKNPALTEGAPPEGQPLPPEI